MNCVLPSALPSLKPRLRRLLPSQPRWSLISLLLLTLLAAAPAAACAGGSLDAVRESAQGTPSALGLRPTPTPALTAPEILAGSAALTEAAQSMRFTLGHPNGSIFVDGISAKITDAEGIWNAEEGAELTVGGFLVSGPAASIDDGIFVQLKLVVTRDAYYLVDPTSRAWTKQPYGAVPLEVERLASVMAELMRGIEDPELLDDVVIDGDPAYQIRGGAPASAMEWTLLEASNRPDVTVLLSIDKADLLPRKALIIGPIGPYDADDTARELIISDINSPLPITLPQNFVDVSGGG